FATALGGVLAGQRSVVRGQLSVVDHQSSVVSRPASSPPDEEATRDGFSPDGAPQPQTAGHHGVPDTGAHESPPLSSTVRRLPSTPWLLAGLGVVLAAALIGLSVWLGGGGPGPPVTPTTESDFVMALIDSTLTPSATPLATARITLTPTATPQFTVTPLLTPLGGGNGLIGYVSCQSDAYKSEAQCLPACVFGVMTNERTCLSDLINDTTDVVAVAWAPQGDKVAYSTSTSTNIIGLDASLTARVDNVSADEIAWSPDGSMLALASQELVVLTGDGNILYQKAAPSLGEKLKLLWSPNGNMLGFTQRYGPNAGIWVLDLSNFELRRLTTALSVPPRYDYIGSWSPDGSKLAVVHIVVTHIEAQQWTADAPVEDIYILDLNDGQLQRLTYSWNRDISPVWSPDGERIAFVSQRDDGDPEIYVMNADGSNQRRLTNNIGDDLNPVWSPDGRRIAFYSERDGVNGIYLMSSYGANVYYLAPGRVPLWLVGDEPPK
ncbi:hypothetical protein D6833_12930, partial [Candidatus Parcubacteria bacterium]